MKLELLSRVPDTKTDAPPILFIHGANCAAWVWEEHMLPDLAARGFEVHAVSLRGHGRSEGRHLLPWFSLADYVTDIAATIAHIGRPPILVGHSMGGMVVQKYLDRGHCAGAVLMASVPPRGLFMTSTDLWLRDPVLFSEVACLQTIGPWMPAAYPITRKVLFSPAMPEDRVRAYFKRWQPESGRVVLDMLGLDLPQGGRALPPMLVLGAADDVFIPPNLVEATARRYGTPVEIFPGMAHAMMLEPGWRRVADMLADWAAGSGRLLAQAA
ncbi:MAG: alpha/beta fold hydrolase [Alphaproteobacteria bacterium]|nr:alpha/beta fold hydrolase [Alphaproteobacteria bacterium]